jgi:hypothetical protein
MGNKKWVQISANSDNAVVHAREIEGLRTNAFARKA